MKKWLLFSIFLNVIGILGVVGLLIYFGGWKNLKYRVLNRGLSNTYEMRKSHFENMETDSSSTIFIGNSLVEYGDWEERLSNFNVKNRGIAGDGIEGVIGRLNTLKNLHPKNIIVLIGLNDLFFHESDWLIERYPKLIAEIKTKFPKAKLFIHSLLPVNTERHNPAISNQIITSVNKELKATCVRHKVEFIDGFALFVNENNQLKPSWTLDGIHLKGEAYLVWAEFLKNSLKNKLKTTLSE